MMVLGKYHISLNSEWVLYESGFNMNRGWIRYRPDPYKFWRFGPITIIRYLSEDEIYKKDL